MVESESVLPDNRLCSRDCDQALAKRRAQQGSFEGVNDWEDATIEQHNRTNIEPAFFEQAKVEPPREIPDAVEVIQSHDLKTGTFEFCTKLRPRIAAEVAEVFVDGRVDFLA